jgi:hypothetical protein
MQAAREKYSERIVVGAPNSLTGDNGCRTAPQQHVRRQEPIGLLGR